VYAFFRVVAYLVVGRLTRGSPGQRGGLGLQWPNRVLRAMWTLFAIAAVVLIMAGVVAWYDARTLIDEERTRLRPADPEGH
jgi:sulfite exporter TauE/SafE